MATQHGVFLRCRVAATPAELFGEFSERDRLARWLSLGADDRTDVLGYDFREGGHYRLGFRSLDGVKGTVVVGVFRDIVPSSKLAMTWAWEPPDPHAGIETLVTIRFEERDGGTELVVTHDRLPRVDVRDRLDEGWRAALDRLTGWLAERSG